MPPTGLVPRVRAPLPTTRFTVGSEKREVIPEEGYLLVLSHFGNKCGKFLHILDILPFSKTPDLSRLKYTFLTGNPP